MELEAVKKTLIDQAKYFLAKAGEFYPFATSITTDSETVPLGVQLSNDYPRPQEVIEILERVVIEKLLSKQTKCAGICTDVNYKPPVDREKMESAIQIRILHNDGYSIDYYLPYHVLNGEYVYGEIIEEAGTLNFLKLS